VRRADRQARHINSDYESRLSSTTGAGETEDLSSKFVLGWGRRRNSKSARHRGAELKLQRAITVVFTLGGGLDNEELGVIKRSAKDEQVMTRS
jgi:hypothetical protein